MCETQINYSARTVGKAVFYFKNKNMIEEQIKYIPGYENLYQITNYGRVWSIKSQIWLKLCINSNRYYIVNLWKNNKSKTLLVHRLVLITFSGIPRNNEECRHLDGNTLNNHIDNLKWGTHQENEQDKILHGTNYGPAKLNTNIIKEIREKYLTGKYFQRQLAKEYGVDQTTISRIILRKNWTK